MPNPVINRRIGTASSTTLNIGLLAFWDMEDATGATRLDSIGSNNLTDTTSAVSQAPGLVSFAALNNQVGANQGLTSSSSTFNLASGSSFSMSFWFKAFASSGSSTYPVIAKANNALAGCDFALSVGSGQDLFLDWHGATGNNIRKRAFNSSIFTTTNWNHFAFGFDSVLGAMWFQINNNVRVYFIELAIQFSSAPLSFTNYGPTGGSPWQGSIDAAGFWNRVLTPLEVSQLYNSGFGQQAPLQYVNSTMAPALSQVLPLASWQGKIFVATGVLPTQMTVAALETFYNGLATDGILSSVLAFNAFVPDSLTAALTPVLTSNGLDMWTNHSYVGGDLTVNGLAGDAATKYLETGINASLLGSNLGIVTYAFSVAANGFDFGSFDTKDFFIASKYSDNKVYLTSGNPRGVVGVNVASPGAGYYSIHRTSGTVSKGYFASSGSAYAQLGATDATVSTGYPAQLMFSGAVQQSIGGPALFTSDRISFQAVTTGLTNVQDQQLFNRVQTLRTSLGGGFV